MPKITATTVNITLNSLVILGLTICVIIGGVLMQQARDAALLLANTKELSQELRQSSDDLTRFVRTYAVTNNESYWEFFNEVIAIRNGKSPLPKEPWRNHWDLYISDGVAPHGYIENAPSLLDRMRAAKFTAHEMELLEEAARRSDALIDLEDVAANAMQGKYRPTDTEGLTEDEMKEFSVSAAPNQTLAMELVHSNSYHVWKGQIMTPLDEFAAISNQRVLDSIDANFRLNLILVIVLGTMLGALIALLLFYFLKVRNDAQMTGLLSTMLPERVVESVSVKSFGELRVLASERAAKLRKHKGVVTQASFPVLYSEYLPMAWVAFTDVVGFTAMCTGTSAKTVISMLNEMFSVMDVEAMSFGIEKIKTIGDAFMCARLTTSELSMQKSSDMTAGVANDGALMVRFLLRTMRLTNGMRKPEGSTDADDVQYLQLRAGMHVGPVASGIVGFERPLYDLFGDTVNTASRLEASGVPDRVHLMEKTMSHFGAFEKDVECDPAPRSVQLKGIGDVSTKVIVGCAFAGSNASTFSGAPLRVAPSRVAYEAQTLESISEQ
jgi:adenylate cyclase